MLLSLVLFGSRARGDYRMRSDVDLLGITEAWRKTDAPYRGTAMYLYDFDYLLKKAALGDLFVCHLVKEGRLLHDTIGTFDRINSEFRYKEEYSAEIKCGSAIIRFLIANVKDLSSTELRKRLVWAIRTILIGRSAENKKAVFSSQALSKFSELKALAGVIDNRYSVDIDDLVTLATRVDNEFGHVSKSRFPTAYAKQLDILRRLGSMGNSTIELVESRGEMGTDDYH